MRRFSTEHVCVCMFVCVCVCACGCGACSLKNDHAVCLRHIGFMWGNTFTFAVITENCLARLFSAHFASDRERERERGGERDREREIERERAPGVMHIL